MDLLAEVLAPVATTPEATRLVGWGVAGMLGVLVVGVVLFYVLRRYALRWKSPQNKSIEAFTMDDLEALRASGQLSDEEFRTLRAGLLGLGDSPPKSPETSSSGVSGDDDGETGGDEPRQEKET
jgi:hypothetical protein